MMMHSAVGKKGAKGVREILIAEDLEQRIKLIVGGAPYLFHSDLFKTVNADAWASNGLEAVTEIGKLMKEVSS